MEAPPVLAGTVHMGDAPPPGADGPTGTVRMDEALGPAGTVRMDEASAAGTGGASGPASTTRMVEPGDLIEQRARSTTRLADSADLPLAAVPAQKADDVTGVEWISGQIVMIQGVDHRIVGSLVGRTGEAQTYQALRGAQPVVLKVYHRGIRMPRDVLERVRERTHANLVRIVELATVDGRDVEVLELVSGGTLADHLRKHGPVRDGAAAGTNGRLRKLVRGVLAGLQHLHQSVGAVYQDLKPDNILLGSDTFDQVRLADFGISTLFKGGNSRVIVVANGTKEYAAPELSRFGNQTETQVDVGVDYFALGITLLECWTGKRPFLGVPDAVRLAQIRDKEVAFPADMDPQLRALIQGLIDPLPKSRWGQPQVLQWLAGQSVADGHYDSVQRTYRRQAFDDVHSYGNPAELATLLERFQATGEDHLYLDRIRRWLDDAQDVTRSLAIQKIARQFDRDGERRRAGLVKAIYVLDPGRPFVTHGGRLCRTPAEFGDALLAEREHYIKALANPLDSFHLYLQATGEADSSTSILALFQSDLRPALAFSTTVYNLQAEDGDSLRLEGHVFRRPEDFKAADAASRDALVKELREDDSRALVWLRRLGVIKGTKGVGASDAIELMSMLKAFDWLQVGQVVSDFLTRSGDIAVQLAKAQRTDLLEVFRDQGMNLDALGHAGRSALHEAAAQQATALVARLLELGATVDQPDRDGDTALCLAVRRRDESTAAVLLRAGANPNARGGDYYTVLSLACSMQAVAGQSMFVLPSLVERLIEAGADVNLADGHGFLPLHLAIAFASDGNVAHGLVDAFLKQKVALDATGADPLLDRMSRRTALINAMISYEFKRNRDPSFLTLIDKLLQAGARVDHMDPADGKTALHHAAKWGSDALSALLVRRGANRLRLSSDGLMPMHFAQAGKFDQLAKLLEPGAAFRWRHRSWVLAHWAARAGGVLLLALMVEPLLAAWRSAEPSPTARWAGGYLLCVVIETFVLLLASRSWRDFREEVRATFRRAWGCFGYLLLGPALVPGFTGLAMLALRWAATRSSTMAALMSASDVIAQSTAQHAAGTFFGFGALLAVAAAATLLLSSRVQRGRKMLATSATSARPPRRLPSLPSLMSSLPLSVRLTLALLLLPPIIAMVVVLGGTVVSRDQKESDQASRRPKPVHVAAIATMSTAFTVHTAAGATCVLPAETRVEFLGDTPPPPEQAQVSVTVPAAHGGCVRRLGSHEVIVLPASILRRNATAAGPGRPAAAGARGDSSPVPAAAMPSAPGRAAVSNQSVQMPAPTPTTALAADATRQEVQGSVTDIDPNGWPIVAGQAVRLQGIAMISRGQRTDFRNWLAGHGDVLDCSPVTGNAYRCLTSGGIDVSEAVLMNGAGIASLGAPASYRSLMVQAQLAKRGQWSQEGR
jgi:ankyrin repeat protein